MAILDVKNLSVRFEVARKEYVTVTDMLSFSLEKGEVLGIVGESGSGKTVTSLSIMRLIPKTSGRADGQIYFEDRDLLKISESEMRAVRGNRISMIFQDPMTSLNPVYTVGNQIVEVIRLHQGLSQKDAKKSALEIMRLVGIHTPEKSFKSYPHEMSGGMRQRIMIAMALVCKPDILIADEPTTALDVTIQAQVLDLMRQLRKSINTAIILITHDLGVVAELADRVIVMYAGQIVEEIMVNELFENCEHPYSKGLLQSIPPMSEDVNRLNTINGVVPASNKMPSGCRFHPRCVECMRICETDSPPEIRINDTHKVRCWLERGV